MRVHCVWWRSVEFLRGACEVAGSPIFRSGVVHKSIQRPLCYTLQHNMFCDDDTHAEKAESMYVAAETAWYAWSWVHWCHAAFMWNFWSSLKNHVRPLFSEGVDQAASISSKWSIDNNSIAPTNNLPVLSCMLHILSTHLLVRTMHNPAGNQQPFCRLCFSFYTMQRLLYHPLQPHTTHSTQRTRTSCNQKVCERTWFQGFLHLSFERLHHLWRSTKSCDYPKCMLQAPLLMSGEEEESHSLQMLQFVLVQTETSRSSQEQGKL
jgi:hypothetical protein